MSHFRKNKKPDKRSYKNFKFWVTSKLKFVIDDPYHRGADGADYAPYIDEIITAYYMRLNKLADEEMNNR